MSLDLSTPPGVLGEIRPAERTPGVKVLRRWFWPLAVGLLAGILRLAGIRHPGTLIFDEHYYVPEASELLAHGVEWNAKTNAADFVAHPPLGKWCIAAGVALFGDNAFGWRAPSAVAGAISVVIIVWLARRLFGSTFLGVAAGMLMALDGMHFVLSRTGILDIFLMTLVLAAFAWVILDRDSTHRWWRFGSALLLGLAMGVKWSAVWYLAVFLGLLVVWDLLGKRRVWRVIGSFAVYCAVSIVGYLCTWAGWFATGHGWRRHWLADSAMAEPLVLGPLINLLRYHFDMLLMHAGLNSDHQYQSQPWEWLLLLRPVLFYWTPNVQCGAQRCDAEILLLGTPALWWASIPAVLALCWLAIRQKDWRAWAIASGFVAGFVPWLLMPERTKFYFYALPSEPFMVLAVVAVLAVIIGKPDASRERRANGHILATAYVAAVALCFVYFYPLYTAAALTHEQWWARLWWIGDSWV